MSIFTDRWFQPAVPARPSGKYVHIILIRETESYPLFQTDGELNTARLVAGEKQREMITRLTMFKRKQSTPERLTGRELLRRYGLISGEEGEERKERDDQGRLICDYNVRFCTQCPDCITYGFAIGDSGSEKAKVITDTAFSLTSYEHSHEAFTLNAPYEDGTMSRHGTVTSRINEQDHITPQVIFPAVTTTRDLTANLFKYVLINLLRSRRYGAQTTRTGRLKNHIAALVAADGEIFSNLTFTQHLYDLLWQSGNIRPPDPVDLQDVLAAVQTVLPDLLHADSIGYELIVGADLDALLNEISALSSDEEQLKSLLNLAMQDSRAYHQTWIAKASRKGK